MKNIYQLTTMRVWRTYLGGALINKLNNQKVASNNYPEDWLLSATTAINPNQNEVTGLSLIKETKVPLIDLIKQNPIFMLGQKHFDQFNTNLALLVKIIDASERLTLQVHPSKSDALKLFNSSFGKTEAWYILNKKPSYVYLGFKPHVTKSLWIKLFKSQNIPLMLDCLHKVEVKSGDVIYIPGGTPHAIGPDCFLIEVQEPTDYTIRTEKTTPSGLTITDNLIHQGLGFEKMFDLFNYQTYTKEQIIKQYFQTKKITTNDNYQEEILLDYDITTNFKFVKYLVNNTLTLNSKQYFGIVILSGSGILKVADQTYNLKAGMRFFIPAATNQITIIATTTLEVICYFGPQLIK